MSIGKNKSFAKLLTAGFSQDCRPGLGEDHVQRLSCPRVTLIACMDGCGGSGARRYPDMGNQTGARLASRRCSIALADWFETPSNGIRDYGLQDAPAERIAQSIKHAIDLHLAELVKRLGNTASAVKSQLSQTLPTTLVLVLIEPKGNAARCIFIWAGDSRAYLLTASGLRQMTEDDVVGGVDPDDISCNGTMSQAVSAESPYVLHAREILLTEPAVLLTATDGCFACFLSPMEFEGALLETLLCADDLDGWARRMDERIGQIASDDYSMQLACFGFASFSDVKRVMISRKKTFDEQYGSRIAHMRSEHDDAGILALWRQYRKDYL